MGETSLCWADWEAELGLPWERGELGRKEPGKPEHAVDVSLNRGKTTF